MNHYAYVMMALDIARERTWEAEQHARAMGLDRARPSQIAGVRRLTARVLAAVSRRAAYAVTRLDTHVGDDLRRTLAHAE